VTLISGAPARPLLRGLARGEEVADRL